MLLSFFLLLNEASHLKSVSGGVEGENKNLVKLFRPSLFRFDALVRFINK